MTHARPVKSYQSRGEIIDEMLRSLAFVRKYTDNGEFNNSNITLSHIRSLAKELMRRQKVKA
jgi:hypothetical protein